MNFGQALELLKAGKRICLPEWRKEKDSTVDHLLMKNGEFWKGRQICWREILSDAWEEYREIVDFPTAMRALVDGKKVGRNDYTLQLRDGAVVFDCPALGIMGQPHERPATVVELTATDWEVLP